VISKGGGRFSQWEKIFVQIECHINHMNGVASNRICVASPFYYREAILVYFISKVLDLLG
jgi:hypothetical protein